MSRTSLLAVLVLVLLTLSAAPTSRPESDSTVEDSSQDLAIASTVASHEGGEKSIIENTWKTDTGGGSVDVVVFTSDVGELGRALQNIPHQGVIGTASYDGLSTPRLTIPSWAVDVIRSLPSTSGVYNYLRPERHLADSEEPLSGSTVVPRNADAVINHRAPEAWAQGYRGEGVEIAIVDDGIDFAHPDLLGTAARYNVSRIPSSTLSQKPWLETYDGWPVSFDPASTASYFASGGKAENIWYANTTSTNDTVWHTVRIDGKNDFWTDGSEKVASDFTSDIWETVGLEQRPDYDMTDLWVTQDLNNWFFGFTTKANHTTLSFGLYIDSEPSGGATSDPVNGNLVTAVAAHAPEFAIYMTHNGGQPPGRYDRNDTIDNATVWKWQGSAWGTSVNVTDTPINGQFSYGKFDFSRGEGFVEIMMPKSYLGNPDKIFVELFSAGASTSHAQDSVYTDPGWGLPPWGGWPAPDWNPANVTQLSAFVEVGRDYWRHTYNRPTDRLNFSWTIHYITTGTSKSGVYYFGNHPDKNLPQTRVLVVDEEKSGVYDTVYVDLDHNKDFRNEKPLKKYGKYDSNMTWHPVDWTGQGRIYDETSYFDFYEPGGAIRALSFSPNGNWLASGGEDHQILLWYTSNWTVKWTVNLHNGRPVSLAFSPDSGSLAAGYDDPSGKRYRVVVFDTLTGKVARVLEGHEGSVNALAWAQGGAKIVSASSDMTARIWDVAANTSVLMQGHTSAVTGVSIKQDGTIATSSMDGTVRLWTSAGQFVKSFNYGFPLTSVDFNPNGTILATGSTDGNVTFWDVSTGTPYNHLFSAHAGNTVLSVRFNNNGTWLVSSSSVKSDFKAAPTVVNWTVRSYDSFDPQSSTGSCYVTATNRGYPTYAAVFSPTGSKIAAGCGNAAIRLWDGDLSGSPTELRGHRIGTTDYLRWDTGDGLPDISGGMIYFIAQNHYYPATNTWGTPIPYSDAYAKRNGQETLFIPANGTLVAFTGEFEIGNKHGTLMASSIVGKGVSRYYDSSNTIPYPMETPTEPQVVGVAPAAKIVLVADVYIGSIFEGWWFTVQGYDGVPMSGDEPQIAANSFGFSSTFEDGWDFYSRFADWISTVYAQGSVAFTVSSSNDGNGYGTVTSPASGPGVITVGASTDFYYRESSGLEGGPSRSFGDVVPFSGRGPTALGAPEPDVLANGRMSYGSTPVNLLIPYNGQVASELWSGTSLSSPLAAGILGLAEQAYKKAHGTWPTASTAKSLLMSSCDDINYDIYSQGAGFLNAERAVKLASDAEGFHVTPSLWTPGNYSGTKYEAFTALLEPGSSDSATFTIDNVDLTKAHNATVSSGIFRQIAAAEVGIKTNVDGTGAGVDSWIVVSGTGPVVSPGIYELLSNPSRLVSRSSLNVVNWINADLLRITARANFSSLDGDHDGVLGGSKDFLYDLDIYDWTYDSVDRYPHTGNFRDLNRMTISHPTANIVQATVHNPAIRTHDGLVIGIRKFPNGAKDIYFRITMEFFKKTDWAPFLTLDSANLTIPANSSATFNATVSAPPTLPIGNYEGAIYVKGNPQMASKTWNLQVSGTKYVPLDHFNILNATVWRFIGTDWIQLRSGIDYTVRKDTGLLNFTIPLFSGDLLKSDYWYDQVVTIPVGVTVPAHGVIFSWPSGIVPGQEELYGNSISAGFGLGGQSGDWRFYPTILPVGGLYDLTKTQRFLAKVSWDWDLTDIDVFGLGPGGSVVPVGSDLSAGRYGPFLVGRNLGGSTTTSLVFTTTGTHTEIVSPALAGGLNIIAVHVVHMNGTRIRENVSGEVGLFGLNPTEMTVVTNKLYGQKTFQIYSSMNWTGIGAVSAGPVPPERYMNAHIKQDSTEGTDFVAILAKGSYTRLVRVKPSALIFSVNISSDQSFTERPCPDLDLGVFLDGKGPGNVPDGISQPEEFVAYSAGSTATEEVRLIRPTVEDDPDTPAINELEVGSPYLIKVLGYNVPWAPYGTFNMDITLVQGVGFSVSGTTKWNVLAYNLSHVDLIWNLPGSTKAGRMLGALYIGPSNAPMMVLVPVTLIIDFTPPEFTKFSISPSGDKHVDAATGRTTNDGMPSLVVEATDNERGELDPGNVRTYLDGKNVSAWTTVNFAYTAQATSNLQGIWSGSVRFVPMLPLSEGSHSFAVSISDKAGNTVTRDFVIVVDTRAPAIAIEGRSMVYTKASTYVIRGTAEPGAVVSLLGRNLVIDREGRFGFPVQLSPGPNDFIVKATDWFAVSPGGGQVSGNSAEAEITVVLDTQEPTLQVSVSPSSLTNAEDVNIYGLVNDTAASETTDPAMLVVTVNGELVMVRPDGTFSTWVSLRYEGQSQILIEAVDLAGNRANKSIVVTRDTEPPSLVLSALPGVVTSDTVNVTGRASAGSWTRVNGYDTDIAADGSFYRVVQLSAGMNLIVVRATDSAGNVAEQSFGVLYASPYSPEAGAVGGYLGMSPVGLAAVLIVIGFLIGFILSIYLKGPLWPWREAAEEGKAEEVEEMPPEEVGKAKEVAAAEGPALEERPVVEEQPKLTEDKREAMLRKAYDEGRISEEVYQENLRRLRGEAAAPEEKPVKTPEDERAERLRKAFEEGKISREVYEENLRRLKRVS